MNPPVKTATFSGRRYNIILENVDGACDTHKKERELWVMADVNTRNGLETLIHESLHACNWHREEIFVASTARDIARFLWRLGYRKKIK